MTRRGDSTHTHVVEFRIDQVDPSNSILRLKVQSDNQGKVAAAAQRLAEEMELTVELERTVMAVDVARYRDNNFAEVVMPSTSQISMEFRASGRTEDLQRLMEYLPKYADEED